MQPARHLVASTAELSAGVEHRVDDLERVLARGMLPDRDAAAIVLDDDAPVDLDRHANGRRMTGHRLVDRVVDDLPHEVMKAALVGRPDVHARASADGLETLEYLDASRGVIRPGAARLSAAPIRAHG